jgi:hypothetical protein
MRTVSFSSPAVQNTLKDRFICACVNTTGEPTAGASFSHAPSDPPGPCLRGNGRQNIQLIFLTPQGDLFHALTGYVGPNDLAEELKFALETYEALQAVRNDRKQVVRDAHTERLMAIGYDQAQIDRKTDDAISDMLAGVAPALTRGNFIPGEVFDGFSRGQVLSDYRFAIRHPLLPWKRFKPAMLVGTGKSFFGSTSSGMSVGGRR